MIGTVEFEAGGKAYSMRLSTNAQVRYQRAAGETLLHGVVALHEDPSDLDRMRRIVWACMSHVEGMTEDQAGDVIDEIGMTMTIEKIGLAFDFAYPEAAKAADEATAKLGNAPRAKKSPKTP